MKKKNPDRLPDKANVVGRNMKVFHKVTDWLAWWEEYYLDIAKDGLPKFKSTYQFACHKGENKTQRDFLRWYLGPVEGQDEAMAKLYTWTKPQDWKKKRDEKGWFSPNVLKEAGKELLRAEGALDALRESGRSFLITPIARTDKLEEQLDTEFQGKFLVSDVSFLENKVRAETYLTLKERLQTLRERQCNLYWKSHGINFEDMQGIEYLLTAAALKGQNKQSETMERQSRVMEQLVSNLLVKNAKYGVPLPPSVENKIIDIATDKKRKMTQ